MNDVEITVRTNDRGASSSIRRVGDEAESMARRVESSSSRSSSRWSAMSGMLAGVGKVATMALGGIAVGAGIAATAGITMGLKTAAGLEQAKISYETLLHSTDKAKQHLADLTKFAAATPFELPGLIQTDKLLIGAGEDASKTLKTLTAWGDAAGALGMGQEQFSRAMLALSQAMGAGKLQAGDLLQITEAGLPIWKLLSEALGKPVSEIRKLSEQGKLLTADVLPKLEKQMEKDYGGAMAKQSQTLNGVWSTFMDTLNMGLAGALQPLIPVLRDALPGAAKVFGDGLKLAATGLTNTVTWFQKATAEGGILRNSFDTIKDHAGMFATVVGTVVVAAFAVWAAGAASAAVATLAATWPILAVVAALAAAAAAVKYAWDHFKPFRDLVHQLAEAAMPALRFALDNLKAAFDSVRNSGVPWKELLKVLGIALGVLAAIIVGTVVAAIVTMSMQLRAVAAAVKPVWQAFITLNRIVLGAIESILSSMLALARTMGRLPGPLGAPWRAMVGPLQTALNSVRAMQAALNRLTSKSVRVNVQTTINGRPASITDFGAYVNVKSGGHTVRAQAHGGIAGAAAGGLRSNLTMVGEYGAELIDLPPGARVHSNPDTARMLAVSGGGGAMIVTLNVYAPIGSQAQLEDWLQSALVNLKRKGRAA